MLLEISNLKTGRPDPLCFDASIPAEAQLNAGLPNPDHPLDVLKLIASSDAADAPVRQAAAVHFKNIVKRGWDESNDVSPHRIGDARLLSPLDVSNDILNFGLLRMKQRWGLSLVPNSATESKPTSLN